MTLQAGHGAELTVVGVVFGLIVVLGYAASRWRRPDSALEEKWGLEDWGLGGRAFGGTMQFFLLGGDLYTAYSFIAVPALVYAVGAPGFFAVAFAVIGYPLVYLTMPRLWSVAHAHGFVTSAEFVRARFGSPALAVLVAVIAVVATLPYIALQLIGLRVVFQAMGIGGDLPLTLAFAVLAFFTFSSGLRAPALLAILKDILLVLTVLMLLLWFTVALGGWGHIFAVSSAAFARRPPGTGALLLPPGTQLSYVSLALGSALSIFLYPHTLTGALAARNRSTVKMTLSTLPVYTLMLGFFGLLGFAAIAAGIRPAGGNVTAVVPELLQTSLGGWGAGLAFAALGIGALVPASIMSIGAANLFTRAIYRPFIRPDASPRLETLVSRIASVVVKLGALAVVLLLTPQFAVDFQLMGGVIILQILPAAFLGLHTNWFHRWALVAGTLAGLASGIFMLYQIPSIGPGGVVISAHFGGDSWPLAHLGLHTALTMYSGLVALALNLAVTVVGTLLCRWFGVRAGVDATRAHDYLADEGDPVMQRMADLIDGPQRYRARHAR
ncbi:MAG: sodium:solute symporter family protein [Gemmatimonadota bacterium]